MRLADTHAHLSDGQFDADRYAVLQRGRSAGVGLMVDVGADEDSSAKAVALAAANPDVWAAVGIHPHDARTMDGRAWNRITNLAGDPKVVAVGETGLDFYRDLSPREAQVEAFREHLALAERVGKAVTVHSREADVEVMAELRPWAGRIRVVLHCFSGSESMLKEAIALGFWISFAGTITYSKADERRRLASLVPVDRLLAETDCPYLAPVPRRGRRNEPALIEYTVAALAQARGVSPREMARVTFENAEAVFGLAH